MTRLKALRSKMIARYNIHFSGLETLDEYVAALIEGYGIEYGDGRVLRDKMLRYYAVCVGTLEASKEKLKAEFESEGYDPFWLDVIEGLFATYHNVESVINICL